MRSSLTQGYSLRSLMRRETQRFINKANSNSRLHCIFLSPCGLYQWRPQGRPSCVCWDDCWEGGCGVRHVGGITSVFLDRRSPPPLGVKLKGSQASLTDRLPIPVRRVSDSFRPTDPDGPRRAQRGEENWGRTDRPALGRRPSTHHLHDAPSDHPHLHALGRPLSDHQPAPLPDFVFFCPAFLPKVSK